MMKNFNVFKTLTAILTVGLLIVGFTSVYGQGEEKSLNVLFNYAAVDVESVHVNVPNIIHEGTTYVQFRRVAEILGKTVEWDAETSTVSIFGASSVESQYTDEDNFLGYPEGGDITVELNAVNLIIEGNGIESANFVYNGRTYVPLRVVSENLGYDVKWIEESRRIDIASSERRENEKVVAKIDGKDITLGYLKFRLLSVLDDAGQVLENLDDENIAQILDLIKMDAAIRKKMAESGFYVDEESIQLIAAVYNASFSDGEKLNLVKRFKVSYGELIETLAFSKVYNDYLESPQSVADGMAPSAEEIEAYCNENNIKGASTVAQVKHVLFKTETEEEKGAVLEKAKQVRDDIISGKITFDEAMTKYGEDPGQTSAGYRVTKGLMVKPFEDASYNQEIGVVGEIVETNYGYHIILVLSREEGQLSDSEMKEVKMEIVSTKINEYAEAHKDEIETEILP